MATPSTSMVPLKVNDISAAITAMLWQVGHGGNYKNYADNAGSALVISVIARLASESTWWQSKMSSKISQQDKNIIFVGILGALNAYRKKSSIMASVLDSVAIDLISEEALTLIYENGDKAVFE